MNPRIYKLFLSPADAGGSGGEDGDDASETARDLVDLGDEGDDDGDDKGDDSQDDDKSGDDDGSGDDDKTGDEDDATDGDEDTGDEDEDKGDKDEDDDKKKSTKGEVDENGRPTFKTLKTEFPDLFKKYPALKAAFFEHPKYQEVFPDVQDAELAYMKVQEYDQLEASIVGKGDMTLLLSTLEENSPKALKKIVETFPEAVRKLDPELYTQLATPFVEELLWHATKKGEKIGGKQGQNLVLAAQHLANYVFANGGEIPDITKRGKTGNEEPSEAEKELHEERRRNNQKDFDRAFVDVATKADQNLSAILGNKLDELTSFERKSVVKDARTIIDRTLKADKTFQKVLSSLWRKAAEDGYSEQSKSRIQRAWLDRAKTIAASTRNRLRQEALDARNPNKSDSKDGDKKRQFSGTGGKNRGGKSSSGLKDPSKIDWKKTSDMDILNS